MKKIFSYKEENNKQKLEYSSKKIQYEDAIV